MDSHGDNVSNDSVREMIDCRGFGCGAYELLFMLLLFDADFRFSDDLADELSFNVGVSTIECSCVFEAMQIKNKTMTSKKPTSFEVKSIRPTMIIAKT